MVIKAAKAREIESYIAALIQAGAVKIAPDTDHLFELRSGPKSWVYVDHGEILCQPETFSPYVDMLAEYVHETFPEKSTILVNVDSKSSPHTVGALASRLRLRQIVVNPEATRQAEKGSGLAMRLPKKVKPNDTFVVVDDVFTEGDTTATRTISLVRNMLAKRFEVAEQREFHLVVGLLRGNPEAATQQLEQLGIQLHWLTSLESVLERVWPTLTYVQRQGLRDQDGFERV